MLQVFHDMGADLVIGANTIVEFTHSRTDMPRLKWAQPRVKVKPVTEQSAKAAAELLKGAGLHGHKDAIDATVAEVALRQPKPVAVLTSDSDDMARLCGGRLRIVPLCPVGPSGARTFAGPVRPLRGITPAMSEDSVCRAAAFRERQSSAGAGARPAWVRV